jgi:hypothetical protein
LTPYNKTCKSKMDYYQEPNCFEQLQDKLRDPNDASQIEFFFTSSLERSASAFDLISRKVGGKILSAFSGRIADNLVI